MPKYIVFSLLAGSFFALSLLVNKFISKHKIENKNSLMFLFMICLLVFSVFFYPFSSKTIPPFYPFMMIIGATATFLVGYYFFYTGILITDASVSAPLFQLQAALIAILAYFFLGERFPLINYLWIGLIILGVVLVSIDEKTKTKSFIKKGVLFILGMQFFHATSNLFAGLSLKGASYVDLIFWEYLIIGLLAIPFYFLTRPKHNYSKKSILNFGAATLLSTIGAVFLLKAYEQNLTISATISLMSSPIVFVVSVIASKFNPQLLEHHTRKVYLARAVGVILILIAAVKLSLN